MTAFRKPFLFWVLQAVGWTAYGLVRYLNGIVNGKELHYIYPTIAGTVAGFLLSLLLWGVYRMIRDKPPGIIVMLAVIMIALLAPIYSAIEVMAYAAFYEPEWQLAPRDYLTNAMFDAYILTGWTGLYFGISYYLLLQQQKEKALRAQALAHQAQLKMLRYQLNPHFLFNTLNAISTLVLDNEARAAGDMISRLSAFLRYTLVGEPTEKIPLRQELHVLGLYLDIEKVRFGDRLEIRMEVAEDARAGLIPGLLLQPLVENAIKYAIAPSETGGVIAISARRNRDRLEIRLTDTGPGLAGPGLAGSGPAGSGAAQKPESSGVGIANTRERLWQIYGEADLLRIENHHPRGLAVTITLPFETAVAKYRGAA